MIILLLPVWLAPFKTHGTGMEENHRGVELAFSPIYGYFFMSKFREMTGGMWQFPPHFFS